MQKLLTKFKNAFSSDNKLRDEVIDTCKKNDIPLTEENILNVLEMIKFRKERNKVLS